MQLMDSSCPDNSKQVLQGKKKKISDFFQCFTFGLYLHQQNSMVNQIFSLAIQKIERLRKPQCLYVCLSVCMSQTLIRFYSMNSSVNSTMISSINQKYIKNHTIFSLAIYKIRRLLAQMCLHSLVRSSQKIIRFKLMNSSVNSFLE